MTWLSRQIDKVPVWAWVAIGFCLLPVVNLFTSREKRRRELPDDHFV